MHICITNLGHHLFRWWLVAEQATSYYLNQSCIIVYWTCRNKVQSNCIRNSNIFIQENESENLIWKSDYTCISFNVIVGYFVWTLKVNFWNSTQNILPFHWEMDCFLFTCEKAQSQKLASIFEMVPCLMLTLITPITLIYIIIEQLIKCIAAAPQYLFYKDCHFHFTQRLDSFYLQDAYIMPV